MPCGAVVEPFAIFLMGGVPIGLVRCACIVVELHVPTIFVALVVAPTDVGIHVVLRYAQVAHGRTFFQILKRAHFRATIFLHCGLIGGVGGGDTPAVFLSVFQSQCGGLQAVHGATCLSGIDGALNGVFLTLDADAVTLEFDVHPNWYFCYGDIANVDVGHELGADALAHLTQRGGIRLRQDGGDADRHLLR